MINNKLYRQHRNFKNIIFINEKNNENSHPMNVLSMVKSTGMKIRSMTQNVYIISIG